jgi:hypothetical protein
MQGDDGPNAKSSGNGFPLPAPARSTSTRTAGQYVIEDGARIHGTRLVPEQDPADAPEIVSNRDATEKTAELLRSGAGGLVDRPAERPAPDRVGAFSSTPDYTAARGSEGQLVQAQMQKPLEIQGFFICACFDGSS